MTLDYSPAPVARERADTGSVSDPGFVAQLATIETLIREGYIGEARFAIRKLLEGQKTCSEPDSSGVFAASDILEKVNHQLLVSRSLDNLGEIIGLIQQARCAHRLSFRQNSFRQKLARVFQITAARK